MDAIDGDNVEIADKVIHESVYSTTSQSRSGIQSTQSIFKLIRFNNSKRCQVEELVDNKDSMADVTNILGDTDNYLPFKNNVEYEWSRFIQANKMMKESMIIFFSNPTLAPIREHLSYKNVDKMGAFLTELLYSKVT